MEKEYKNTDLGLIPEDWEVKNILENSIMKARIGWQGLTVSEYMDKGDYYLITGTDFVEGRIKWDTCHFVEKSRYNQDKNIQIKAGDILITKDGTIGKIAFVDDLPLPATLNSGVFVIRPKKIDNYLPKFLFYIFNSFYFNDFLNRLTAGSTIVHLYQKDFTSFDFPLPPSLAEQTAIATALNDADALIQKLEQLIAKKRLIKTGAMQELLKPKEGWEKTNLGKVAVVRDGTHQTPKYVHQGIPFYSVENVTANDFTNTKFISQEEHSFLTKNWKIERGDILMTRIGSIGVCKYIDWEVNASFYVSLALLKVNKEYSSKFICQYSQFEFFKRELELNSLQFAYPQKINLGQISKVKLIIPKSKEEQEGIAQILSDIDNEISALEKQLEKYKLIKQGMMQQLLTGKIRLI